MHVNGLFVALSLSAVEVVVAGVCRPGSTTLSSESSAPEASSSTVSVSTGASSTIVSISTETSSTASTEASSIVSTEASSATISISTDASTTLSISTTSVAETTSTTEATTTTSAGPPPIPTFNVVASGGGSAAGTRLSSSYRAPFITFGYEAGEASDEFFSIEPETGRLRTSNPDMYVCATFDNNNQPEGTARLVNCIQQNIDVGGDYISYLTCGLSDGKVTCTAPRTNCYREEFEWYCNRDNSGATVGKLFVAPKNAWGYSVGIAGEVPNGHTEVEWNALVV